MADLLGATPQNELLDFYTTYKPLAMIVNIIACIVCVTFGFIVLFHRNSMKSGMASIYWFSVMSIMFFGICCSFLTAAASEKTINSTFQITQFLYGLTWIIAESLCYLIYIGRLKNAFKESQYALSNKQLYGFYISIIIFFIGNVIIWGIVGFVYNTSRLRLKRAFRIDAGLYFLLQIIDLIVSGILIHLFINKLLKFIQQFNDVNNFKMLSDKPDGYKLTDSQKSIVSVMTKWFILSLFVIISTQINLISNCILYLMVGYRNDKIFLAFYIVQTILSAINCVMSSICIYLNFEFGQSCYDRLCGKINIYFTLMFKKYSQTKIIQNHYKALAHDDEINKNANCAL